MKKLLFAISIALMATNAKAQCTNKIQIESILVNACNGNGAVPEEYNEMVRFRTGSNPLNITNISVGGSTNAAAPVAGKWPNTNQHWNGLTQNATTSALTASLQATVISSCGKLLEPPAGIIPANKEVIIVTSQQMTPAYNSFANLTDTIYMVYQTSVTTTGGHFANHTSTGTRNLVLFDNGSGCSDTVHYDTQLLTAQVSTSNYDGGTVVYDNAGNATYTNIGCHAPFVPLSASSSSSATSVCSTNTLTLTGSAAGSYSSTVWTGGAGTIAHTNSLVTTYTPGAGESGSITFTLTVNGKCPGLTATSTVSVFINPAPSPTITSSNGPSICNGTSTTLSVTSTGTLSTTYTWTPSSPTVTGTSFTVAPTNTATPTVYTVSAHNTCGTTPGFYTVTTNPLPNIVIAPDSVCPGATATLTATGANTYTWSPSGVTTSTISASNVTSNMDYSVTGTSNLGCKNTQVGHIVVRISPTITTNSASVCEGALSVLTASGGASNSYTWSPGGPSGNNTYSVTPASTTPIVVTGADVHGCTNTHTVTVNATPTITVYNASTCSGQAVTLQASPATLTSYTWTGAASSVNTVTVSPNSTTSYSVIGTDANGCVSNEAVSTVSVTVATQITVSSSSNFPCIGSTYTLSANGATTYTWTPNSGSFTSLNANNTQISVTQTTAAVTFTVSGVGSCPATPTVVTINPAPVTTLTINALPANATVCNGGSLTLTASGAISYTWTPAITNAVTFTPTVSDIYTVDATDANGCSAVTSTISVTVNPLTTLTVNSPSICAGGTATLTALGANTYTWSTGATTATTTAIPTSVPLQTYTVIGTDVNNCLSTVATASVTTLITPTITVVANPAGAAVCTGSSITLSGSGSPASTYTYSWSGPGGITDATPFIPAGSQNYTVTGTDANGCKGTATQSVTVNPLPTVTVTSSNICLGSSATLQAGGTATTYTWSTLAQTTNITVQPPTAGITTYTVAGTDINGCINAAVATVTANVLPIISITPSSNSVCSGSTVTLTANGAGMGGGYTWDSGSNNNPVTENPTTSTTYTVVGTDVNDCSNTYTITINTSPLPIAQTISGNNFVCKGYMASPTVLSAQSAGYWTGPAPSTATVSINSSTANITTGGVYTLHIVNNCGQATSTFTVMADSVIAGFNANPISGQIPVTVSYTNTSITSSGNSLSYSWDFGNLATSSNTNPTETFTAAGAYQTTLTATDNLGCKDTATVYVIVKDVPEVVVIPNIFSPNGDNINDQYAITATGVTNFECKIYDRWGLLLYSWAGLDGFWDGKSKSGSNCTEGTYFYLVTYTDNQGKSIIKNSFFQLVR